MTRSWHDPCKGVGMKKLISPTVLAAVLTLALSGFAQANPSIQLRDGPNADEQSPSANDLSISDRVSHTLSTNGTLAKTRGDIWVITTTDHLVLLRGTVSKDEDHDKIMSVLGSHIGVYTVEDDLVTISR